MVVQSLPADAAQQQGKADTLGNVLTGAMILEFLPGLDSKEAARPGSRGWDDTHSQGGIERKKGQCLLGCLS